MENIIKFDVFTLKELVVMYYMHKESSEETFRSMAYLVKAEIARRINQFLQDMEEENSLPEEVYSTFLDAISPRYSNRKVFLEGDRFDRTCPYTGASHTITVVAREGKKLFCTTVCHETDGMQIIQEEYMVTVADDGCEMITLWAMGEEKCMKRADHVIRR